MDGVFEKFADNKYIKRTKAWIIISGISLVAMGTFASRASSLTPRNYEYKLYSTFATASLLFTIISLIFSGLSYEKFSRSLDENELKESPEEFDFYAPNVNILREQIKESAIADDYAPISNKVDINICSIDYYARGSTAIIFMQFFQEEVKNLSYKELLTIVLNNIKGQFYGKKTTLYLYFVFDSIPEQIFERLYLPWGQRPRFKVIPFFFDMSKNKIYMQSHKYENSVWLPREEVQTLRKKFPEFFEK